MESQVYSSSQVLARFRELEQAYLNAWVKRWYLPIALFPFLPLSLLVLWPQNIKIPISIPGAG